MAAQQIGGTVQLLYLIDHRAGHEISSAPHWVSRNEQSI
jgi:hypothetical protein